MNEGTYVKDFIIILNQYHLEGLSNLALVIPFYLTAYARMAHHESVGGLVSLPAEDTREDDFANNDNVPVMRSADASEI